MNHFGDTIFERIERPDRLPKEVALNLLEAIDSGHLKAGDRIPSEQALAKQFGVARTVVREAISLLKHDGIILAKQGVGAFVDYPANRQAFRISPACFEKRKTLHKLLELRTAVHAEAAAIAARNITDSDLEYLGIIYADLKRLIPLRTSDADELVRKEDEFYLKIAEFSSNEYFVQFVCLINSYITENLWSVAVKNARASEMNTAVLQEHTAVFEAIENRDVDSARTAARKHFECAAQRLADRADFLDTE